MKIKIYGLLFFVCTLSIFYSCTANKTSKNNPDNVYFDKKYIKSVMVKTAEWQLKNPKHNLKDWTNGAFYSGLFAAWKTTKSKELYDSLMVMGEKNNWEPYRRFYHADDHTICQTYIDLYRIEKKDRMIKSTVDTLLKFIEKPYPTKGVEVIKWWWCDALFMAPPVLAKLGVTTGDDRFLKANDKYYRETYDLLYNKEEHLFARDLNYVLKPDGSGRKEANGRLIFWSRGNGWVIGGLALMLKELPANYPERSFYENLFKEMANRIADLQQEDGLWRASLLDPKSYPGGEVSGSGFFCYALSWGINNKLLNKEKFLPVVRKAWVGLNKCVNEDGRIGWVQPIGGDPQRNISANTWEVYGTGAFLLAGSEIIKLPKNR